MRISKVVPLLVVLLVNPIFAQRGFPPNEKDRVKDLKEKLQLTDEQTKKVESIFNNNKKKMDASFENKDRGSSDPRKMMDSIMNATDKEIEKVLTKDQKTKYLKMIEERKEQMKKMPPPPPPQGRYEDDRGMIHPDRQLGFNDRMDRPEGCGRPEMQRPRPLRMGKCDREGNMCPGCCMKNREMMPLPDSSDGEEEMFLPDEPFDL